MLQKSLKEQIKFKLKIEILQCYNCEHIFLQRLSRTIKCPHCKQTENETAFHDPISEERVFKTKKTIGCWTRDDIIFQYEEIKQKYTTIRPLLEKDIHRILNNIENSSLGITWDVVIEAILKYFEVGKLVEDRQ